MKLTARGMEKLAQERVTCERFVWDDDVPGLGLRMRPGGSRNWVFQYKLGKKHRRMTLGRLSAIGLAKAQDIARDLHAKVRLGGDPAADKADAREQAADTFDVIAKRFLEFKQGKIATAYHAEMTRHLLVNAKPLHEMPIKGVKRRHVAGLLSDLREAHGDSTADHVRASLSGFFTWALKEGLMGDDAGNPVAATHKEKPRSRERVLTIDELREVWEATADAADDYNEIVRLLILTLQRRDEIGGLARGEVGFGKSLITLPPARTKNRLEHKVPMAAPVIDALQKRPRIAGRTLFFGLGEGGYSGWSKAKGKLDARILDARRARLGKKAQPMPHWVLHDLRRTGDTLMNDDLGIDPHVVEAILNHISGAKSGKDGVAGVYNRAEYLAKKKAALDAWAAFVTTVVAVAPTPGDRPSERQADALTDEPAEGHRIPAE